MILKKYFDYVKNMNDLDYLISQLNLLMGFLDVSDEQVYEQIKGHDRYDF